VSLSGEESGPDNRTADSTELSMSHVPSDPPDLCPVCETAYESVSEHSTGLMVGLDRNEEYRRVCFEPHTVDGEARIRFYHHTHEQAEVASPTA